jgi:hypothetical protein
MYNIPRTEWRGDEDEEMIVALFGQDKWVKTRRKQ